MQGVGEREAVEMQAQVANVAEVSMRAGAAMETKVMKLMEVGARLQEVIEVVVAMVMKMQQGAEDAKSTAT